MFYGPLQIFFSGVYEYIILFHVPIIHLIKDKIEILIVNHFVNIDMKRDNFSCLF